MIYIIIGMIIGAILFLCTCETILGKIFGFFAGILGGFCAGALIWITIGSVIGSFLPCHYVITGNTNIVALNDNSATSGSFFLGCGTIDNKTVYKYVINTDNGKQVRELEDDDDTVIYIKEYNKNPKIEYKSWDFINQNYYWFSCPSILKDDVITFYLPEGSVTNKFSIDLE